MRVQRRMTRWLSRLVSAAWIAYGSGCGIGMGRGTRGRSTPSWCRCRCRFTFFGRFSLLLSRSLVDYVDAAAVTVVAATVLQWVALFLGLGERRVVERWAAGQEVDRAKALAATYALTRKMVFER